MNPQVPIVPLESSEVFPVPQTTQLPQSPQPMPKPKDNHWISILAMAIFVVLSLGVVAFLYYQNQALKSMLASLQTPIGSPQPSAQAATPVASPSATPDTTGWKTFTNAKYNYAFKCPSTSTHQITMSSGDGTDKPLYAERCYEGQNQISVEVYPVEFVYPQIPVSENSNLNKFTSPDGKENIYMTGFDKTYFNQILSTFKFTESLPSASPISSATPIPTSIPSTIPNRF